MTRSTTRPSARRTGSRSPGLAAFSLTVILLVWMIPTLGGASDAALAAPAPLPAPVPSIQLP